MRGTHRLIVRSAHQKYEMLFSRNITIIRGDSATGKTTLVDMVQEHLLNGTDTGISLSCDRPCRVLAGATWQEQLRGIEKSIVFIDEGNSFVSSTDFARAAAASDNYYVIITREPLYNLPYSVTEIYGIRSSGKYGSLEPVYHEMYRIYGFEAQPDRSADTKLITEDTNSGYEFFAGAADGTDIHVESAGGASRIFELLNKLNEEEAAVVIADGAAFGPYMSNVYRLMLRRSGVSLYLPESFEWLILSSDILKDTEVREILREPEEHIESRDYFSWERFFTALLTDRSRDTQARYSKTKLNPVYLQGGYKEKILRAMPDEIRKLFEKR